MRRTSDIPTQKGKQTEIKENIKICRRKRRKKRKEKKRGKRKGTVDRSIKTDGDEDEDAKDIRGRRVEKSRKKRSTDEDKRKENGKGKKETGRKEEQQK
jgi:hypothetical protein